MNDANCSQQKTLMVSTFPLINFQSKKLSNEMYFFSHRLTLKLYNYKCSWNCESFPLYTTCIMWYSRDSDICNYTHTYEYTITLACNKNILHFCKLLIIITLITLITTTKLYTVWSQLITHRMYSSILETHQQFITRYHVWPLIY